MRKVVYEVYEEYLKVRSEHGKSYDWDDIANAVLKGFEEDSGARLYRHIVVDEAQDLSPVALRSLASAIPADGSMTVFADAAQQIFSDRASWREAGLQNPDPISIHDNFRNTQQISALALAISRMPHFSGIPDLIEPVNPAAAGPLPTLVSCSTEEAEFRFLGKQASAASATQSVAILVRTHEAEQRIKPHLSPPFTMLHREMPTWPGNKGLFVGTVHSAKGLEFDTVILPHCTASHYPEPELIKAYGNEIANTQDAKLLYVAVTRAKTRLVITYVGSITHLLPTIESLYTRTSI